MEMSHQQSCNKAASEALQVSAQGIEAGSAALRANGETLQAGNHALQSNSNALEAGNETLKADQVLSSHFELASEAQKSFADLKYWLTDLAVSWLNESEENADAAGERLAGQLEKIAAFAPKLWTRFCPWSKPSMKPPWKPWMPMSKKTASWATACWPRPATGCWRSIPNWLRWPTTYTNRRPNRQE
jgi:hypothetical protein